MHIHIGLYVCQGLCGLQDDLLVGVLREGREPRGDAQLQLQLVVLGVHAEVAQRAAAL